MQKIKKHLLNVVILVVIAVLLTHCQQKNKGTFTVTVMYKNLDKMVAPENEELSPRKNPDMQGKAPRILLEEIPYGGDLNPIILDSAELTKKNGKVILNGTGKEEAIFQLVVENGPLLLLINDESNINIDIDLSKRENYYTVNGSEASRMLKDFIRQYSEKSFLVNKAFAELDSLKQLTAPDSLIIVSTEKKNKMVNDLNKYLQSFLRQSEHPALSLFALGWSSRSFPRPDFEKSLADVVKKFPDHEVLKKVKT